MHGDPFRSFPNDAMMDVMNQGKRQSPTSERKERERSGGYFRSMRAADPVCERGINDVDFHWACREIGDAYASWGGYRIWQGDGLCAGDKWDGCVRLVRNL